MVMINWRDVKPQIVHDAGIDFQLLKGQGFADPNLPTACMQGMYYVCIRYAASRKKLSSALP